MLSTRTVVNRQRNRKEIARAQTVTSTSSRIMYREASMFFLSFQFVCMVWHGMAWHGMAWHGIRLALHRWLSVYLVSWPSFIVISSILFKACPQCTISKLILIWCCMYVSRWLVSSCTLFFSLLIVVVIVSARHHLSHFHYFLYTSCFHIVCILHFIATHYYVGLRSFIIYIL